LIRPSFRKHAALFVWIIVFFSSPAWANADYQPERIKRYESIIRVQADGWLTVTENITVYCANQRITHGIYRDFPLRYRNEENPVLFIVDTVLRDGYAEPFSLASEGIFQRVYIGSKDELAPRGVHTYSITYRTAPHLNFDSTFDELYWNVTGNEWVFAIESVVATIILPGMVKPAQLVIASYVGPGGSTESGGRIVPNRAGATFQSRQKLAPNEGMTIDLRWPKGLVAAPLKTGVLSIRNALVLKDGDRLSGTETIKVATNLFATIKGISLESRYGSAKLHGLWHSYGFAFDSVFLDGVREPFTTYPSGENIRLTTGTADETLSEKVHQYTIHYHGDAPIFRSKKTDQFVWSIPNLVEWKYPIDKVTTSVALRDSVVWNSEESSNGESWWKVCATMPRGSIAPLSDAMRFARFTRDNPLIANSLRAMLFIAIIYLLFWFKWGRDPKRGVIRPMFTPPENLSPAGVRYILKQAYDDVAFTCGVVGLATKGAITIDKPHGTYTLIQTDAAATAETDDESALRKALFIADKSVRVHAVDGSIFDAARRDHYESLRKLFEGTFVLENRWLGLVGLVGLVVGIFTTLHGDRALFATAFGLSFFTMVGEMIVWLRLIRIAPRNVLIFGGSIAGLIPTLLYLRFIGSEYSWYVCAALLFMIIASMIFIFVMKRPTVEGRKILDEIEGFRLFLTASKEELLGMSDTPADTPQLFEKHLAYALALDVAGPWSGRFATPLKNVTGSYSPQWYHGDAWDNDYFEFSRRLRHSFSADLAGATNKIDWASSSGSGSSGSSSGGGFHSSGGGGSTSSGSSGSSGGGRGGGGGGGW
jgi:hypothetical protein